MDSIKKLESMLLSKNIVKNFKKNEEFIFKVIPELKYAKGFEQRNKYHCYDVWNHTIEAMSNSKNDLDIRLVLLLHDIGKPFSYQEENGIRHFKGHAQKSEEIARVILKRLGYEEYKIEELCFLIGNHATTIKEEMLNINNIRIYKKLLYIQYCDASAYAPIYAKEILLKLDKINNLIEKYITDKSNEIMINMWEDYVDSKKNEIDIKVINAKELKKQKKYKLGNTDLN